MFNKKFNKVFIRSNLNTIFSTELIDKINNFIKVKFSLIYDYQFDGIVLLCSGAIRSLIMDEPVKDLDFIILTQGKCEIFNFIKKYKLKYSRNAGGGYKILYDNFTIDMFTVNDLCEAVVYDFDLMFFDIKTNTFINVGIIEAISKYRITEINIDEKNIMVINLD